MSMIADIAYFCLCCVVTAESVLLRTLLLDTLRLKRLYLPPELETNPNGPPLATLVPMFVGQLLDSSDRITEADLRGHATILFFVTTTGAMALAPGIFAATISALWNKVDGPVYVVCNGDADECRRLRDEHGLRERYGDTVRFVHDERSDLIGLFNIHSLPSAIQLDEDGYVRKSGRPLPTEEFSAENASLVSAS